MAKFLHVIKRDGTKEEIHFDHITKRLLNLCNESQRENLDIAKVASKVIIGLYPGVTTAELDNLAAEICASMASTHIEYQDLAGRIVVSNMHKETKSKFSEVFYDLYNEINVNTSRKSTLIADDVYEIVMKNAENLDAIIDYNRDYNFGYFGFKTLERAYLLKINNKIVERPQHMLMRVAVGIHKDDIKAVIETYNLLSDKWFIHASPTLFNAGTKYPQMSSCFLLTMKDDSIDGIFSTLKECALISKYAGGIGLNVHCIRSTGSLIEGTNGQSNGLIPMLQVFNFTARYVDQGGNKRPGAFAIYIEPWHADVMDFLQLRKNHGDESKKARDLFLALWIPDLFMKRVHTDGDWTLMDPNKCRGLSECWGAAFEELYEQYEQKGQGTVTMKARQLWKEILDSQIETGTPYMLYKDACNGKSNQQNLGTIKCSNLCTEIVQYSSPDEIAVCNLASISLPRFVNRHKKTFDFDKLIEVTGVITNNLNKIIDVNHYPIEAAKISNLRHRPIGIGVQGLADVFAMMRYPFDSPEAAALNRRIFETIYFGALKKSCALAAKDGPYETYDGSPVSKGVLQPDMWGVQCSEHLDWAGLRADIARYGVRNSLLTAPMPTASTAQILGNNECFEPFTNNIYVRRVLSGEFVVVNRYLVEDLLRMGLWSDALKNALIANRGSVQHIGGLPEEIKRLYRTVWEVPQAAVIRMAADRAPFIDQSQSMNLHVDSADYQTLTSLHLLSWKKGLKTGMYYLRTRPAADPIQFTVDRSKLTLIRSSIDDNIPEADLIANLVIDGQEAVAACSLKNKDGCTSCQG